MKLPRCTATVILLILVVETQCGVIDNLFGRVKNTTNALKQDARNVLSYSKSVVGIETPVDNRSEDEKRGLIGGLFHTTQEKVHNIRTYFWNTDANSKDSGLFGNMFNRVTNGFSKVKGSILGGDQIQAKPPSENEKLIQKTLQQLFFGNGTRQVNGRAFQDAVENLRRKLQEIRSHVKKEMEEPVHHGEGLIDVRLAAVNLEDSINDNTPGVKNDIYDAVEIDKSYNNIKDNGDRAVTSLTNGVISAADQLNIVRDNAIDAANKEIELLKNGHNNIRSGSQKIESSMKNTVENAQKLSY